MQHEEERDQDSGEPIISRVTNQLSPSQQDDCKTRKHAKYYITHNVPNTTPDHKQEQKAANVTGGFTFANIHHHRGCSYLAQ